MLNELSCWYFDWSTVGTWLGGLATAGATGFGVYAANKAWNSEKQRRLVKTKAQAILLEPELANANFVAGALINGADEVFNTPEKLFFLRRKLTVETAKEMLRSNGELKDDLAVALSVFVATISMLQDALDLWEAGPWKNTQAKESIINLARTVNPKVEKLQERLDASVLGSRELLDAALSL